MFGWIDKPEHLFYTLCRILMKNQILYLKKIGSLFRLNMVVDVATEYMRGHLIDEIKHVSDLVLKSNVMEECEKWEVVNRFEVQKF